METVEVVIRLPKEDFDYVQETVRKQEYPLSKFYHNIANDTVLPKGHGRLADLDAALKCVEDCEDCEDKTYAIALFDWACSKRVVLEADKEASE
jgi:hypothetical protein